MELMTWDADLNDSSGGFKEGYYLAGDSTGVAPTRWKELTTVSANHYAHLTVTVQVVDQANVGGVAYAKEAILEALIAGGKKFDVVAYAKDSTDAATKALFYGAGVNPSVAPTAAGANQLTLNGSGTSWAADTYTYTFHASLYIDGAGSTYNQNVKGDVKVVVSGQA